MADRSVSSAASVSHQSSITAQESGVAVVPQLLNCQIVGNVNIRTESNVNTAANHSQPTSTRASNTGGDIIMTMSEELKHETKIKFIGIYEGVAKRGKQKRFRDIYTELSITEGETEMLNREHEVRQNDTFQKVSEEDVRLSCNDIFKPLNCQGPKQELPVRTVLTKGIAGIGKTVSVQKFVLDWAEGEANQDIDLLFVLPFRELKSKKENCSLHELLLEFHYELKKFEKTNYYDDCKLMFIFDGLDESQLPLDFGKKRVSNVFESAPLDELITNLINGNLLPSAFVWITSRPAAIDKIPPDLIHRITEVRGFADSQKKQYFRNRVQNEDLANKIIAHVTDSRSLDIMCHIPVFCWITATVLEKMLSGGSEAIPSPSLTELYTRFTLIQTNKRKEKHLSNDQLMSGANLQLLLKLGKLAFENLQKNNIVFSKANLHNFDINVTEAQSWSGVLAGIVIEEDSMFPVNKYSFVHLSVQEYLAAFFVSHKCAVKRVNVLRDRSSIFQYLRVQVMKVLRREVTLYELHKCAINQALKSSSGHLDLFLRFLLGFSMESSQKLLKKVLVSAETTKKCIPQTIQYLKSKLREEDDKKAMSSERCINLFLCLLELDDHSMGEEMRSFLTSGQQGPNKLSAAQCSTLSYIILMSKEILEELDLKKYSTSREGRRRLLPAVKNCRKALMANCSLTDKCCKTVASELQHPDSHLIELDLSSNSFSDTALESLHSGLNSPYCKLESLNLSHINLEKLGELLLKAVLLGPHHQPHTLRLVACSLKDDCAGTLRSALREPECQLRELDISYNILTSYGVQLVLQGLQSPSCYLELLRLSGCEISADSCKSLTSALARSFLRELILYCSSTGDDGIKLLCPGLMSPHCQLHTLGLKQCKLSSKACSYLAEALSTSHVLQTLNLRDNDLQDSGVVLLSGALKNPNCVLQKLGLSGCLITEEGCLSLASALRSNPSSVLKDLDLSYNHPGISAEKQLSDLLHHHHCRLERLRLDRAGQNRLEPGFLKYYRELSIDWVSLDQEGSSNRKGILRFPGSELNTYYDEAGWVDACCGEKVREGRFYWEMEWSSTIIVDVLQDERPFQSKQWYFSIHINQTKLHSVEPKRFGLYLDWPAGTLSFYSICSRGVIHLYTFHISFGDPVIPRFVLQMPDIQESLGAFHISHGERSSFNITYTT